VPRRLRRRAERRVRLDDRHAGGIDLRHSSVCSLASVSRQMKIGHDFGPAEMSDPTMDVARGNGESHSRAGVEAIVDLRLRILILSSMSVFSEIVAAIDPNRSIRLTAAPSIPQSDMALLPRAGFLC
jgi:hypothetical protein